MIFMGFLMFTGKMNAITGYLSGTAGTQTSSKETTKKEIKEEKQDTYPATDFVLQDQYGKEHSLADYKGKTIFLNFWATWCGPCRNEMPEIQKIYEEIYTLCLNMEGMMEMFSKELEILDRNTVKLMIDEMEEELAQVKASVAKQVEEQVAEKVAEQVAQAKENIARELEEEKQKIEEEKQRADKAEEENMRLRKKLMELQKL